MLKQLYELASRVLAVTQDTHNNSTDIKDLQQQVQVLSGAVQELAFEVRRLRDEQQHEREKMGLRFENALLKVERKMLIEGEEAGR